MNPKLTQNQEKQLCSLLGNVKLSLLIHGYTRAAFHQKCDHQGPTVSVGSNSTGFVFRGYTSKDHDVAKHGHFIQDDKAFLFRFNDRNPIKYPVTDATRAVQMNMNTGPYFGDSLYLINNNTTVYSNPGNCYNFNAAEIHVNNLQLTECEVYKVEGECGISLRRRKALMEPVKLYRPMISSVGQARVILIGPVADAHGFRQSVNLQDRIHWVAYVMDTCKVSIMSTKLEEKLAAIHRRINLLGIPQLVLLTKVDEACPCVADNLRNVYNSQYIKAKAQEVSGHLGVPMSCIVPVKNYNEELELGMSCDILLLSALIQMLRFADNYFHEANDNDQE
ncbi:unnamed protein product [Coregonus sp. 'balchen']|nr:unnamed protein product [Coregonus sp. 'balchen']